MAPWWIPCGMTRKNPIVQELELRAWTCNLWEFDVWIWWAFIQARTIENWPNRQSFNSGSKCTVGMREASYQRGNGFIEKEILDKPIKEKGRTVRICPLLWKIKIAIVHFAHVNSWLFTIPISYNHSFLGLCAPSFQMRVKDWSYSFITRTYKNK